MIGTGKPVGVKITNHDQFILEGFSARTNRLHRNIKNSGQIHDDHLKYRHIYVHEVWAKSAMITRQPQLSVLTTNSNSRPKFQTDIRFVIRTPINPLGEVWPDFFRPLLDRCVS